MELLSGINKESSKMPRLIIYCMKKFQKHALYSTIRGSPWVKTTQSFAYFSRKFCYLSKDSAKNQLIFLEIIHH